MVLTEGQKQAIEKLDAEMEKAKDSCSKYIAEQLLQLASSCPEVAEKILAEKKSLAGALDAIGRPKSSACSWLVSPKARRLSKQ